MNLVLILNNQIIPGLPIPFEIPSLSRKFCYSCVFLYLNTSRYLLQYTTAIHIWNLWIQSVSISLRWEIEIYSVFHLTIRIVASKNGEKKVPLLFMTDFVGYQVAEQNETDYLHDGERPPSDIAWLWIPNKTTSHVYLLTWYQLIVHF